MHSRWTEFKDGQNPRTGEIIAAKGYSGIYPQLLHVEGILSFSQFGDRSTKVLFHGLTHWILVDSPY